MGIEVSTRLTPSVASPRRWSPWTGAPLNAKIGQLKLQNVFFEDALNIASAL